MMKKLPGIVFSLILLLIVSALIFTNKRQLLTIPLTSRSDSTEPETVNLWADFEEVNSNWQTEPEGKLLPVNTHAWQGERSLQVSPGGAKSFSVFYSGRLDWSRWSRLEGKVWVPTVSSQLIKVFLLLRDEEHFWYRCQSPSQITPGWNDIGFRLNESTDWLPLNHHRPWSEQVARTISQVRFYFQAEKSLPEFFHLDYLCLIGPKKILEKPLVIYDFVPGPARLPRYHLWESSFLLSRSYSNPFDPECVEVIATFVSPDGSRIIIPAFYYQEYQRQLIEGKEYLTPVGDSRWVVRFTPTVAGRYRYFFAVKEQGREHHFPGSSFYCQDSAEPGFVRVSQKDCRFFQHDDGSFYYPIGLNIISPWDTPYGIRYLPTRPVGRETYAYDDYFEKMAANQMNFIRLWMAYWWLELEWNQEKGPFSGLGRYSLQNAWRLDHIVREAEKKNIKILLTINNHTRLTSWGWSDNPYNVAAGGFLREPREMFTDKLAKNLFQKKMRYIIARWAYSPAIFSWDLWSEVDLTSGYHSERVRKWHQEMARFIREIDPWRHLISTHFCQHPRTKDLADLPELDFIHSNAWVNVATLSDSQVEAIEQFYRDLSGYGKPVLISEYGGHWAGTQIEIMTRDLHTGLWANAMNPLAGTPLFWWWNLVHQDDLYFHYRALAAFLSGEDYRQGNLQIRKVMLAKGHPAAGVCCLAGDDVGFLWIYNFSSALRLVEEKTVIQGLDLTIPGLKPGRYSVEWWDTWKGNIFKLEESTSVETGLTLTVPPFADDLAAKVKCYHE
ncbi:MAG: DUF5060 domain-containing protein [Candidatus Omnitrophica bacterium]|nr:DUF5060 domain-containing protein [Candidatus Omnitrophota bacterium]